MTAQPGDGVAVILHLIEAVREFRKQSGNDPSAVQYWTGELEAWLEREVPTDDGPAGWEARRWGELLEGDTVTLAGVEAVVESAIVLPWHVDPRSNEYRPSGLEHARVALRLVGREPLYTPPADGEVETLRGQKGQAADEANGRRRGFVLADREMVLKSWAADAFETLAATGLNPEPIVMTPEAKG